MNNTISPEDMASFEVVPTHNHGPDSFPSEEYSFLPEVSGAIPNGDINHLLNNSYDLTNMQSALGASMPSTAVAHTQLLEIIEENRALKEKLNKNNAMMKEQMSTISAWREHMIAAKDQQQESLIKAKEKISALEKENAKLVECLNQGQGENIHKEEKALVCEKCTVFEGSLSNVLAIDSFENTDDDILLAALSSFQKQLLPNYKQLCSLVEILANNSANEDDKRLLKTFILLLKFKIAALEEGNSSATVKSDGETGYAVVHRKSDEEVLQLRSEVQLLKKTLEETENLRKALNAKHEEVCCLKEEREELFEKIKNYEAKIQEYEVALKSKFELMNNKLDIEASLSEKYKERCESLQQQVEEYQVRLDRAKMSDDCIVKELREDIQNLQDILKLEQEANQNAKDKLAQVMLKCEKLQVDYDRVSKVLELESGKVKELSTLKEKEAKESLSKIDEVTAQLFEMEEQKRECERQIRDLSEKLADAAEQTSDIPIFKQQIAEYAKDFASIREAHGKATEEAEQLKNELKKYESKTDSCPCACGCHSSRKHRNSKSSADSKEQNNDAILCPFCQQEFKKESEINRHILRVHNDES